MKNPMMAINPLPHFKAVTPKTHHPETCSFYHLLININ
jgi:hypothetical protein